MANVCIARPRLSILINGNIRKEYVCVCLRSCAQYSHYPNMRRWRHAVAKSIIVRTEVFTRALRLSTMRHRVVGRFRQFWLRLLKRLHFYWVSFFFIMLCYIFKQSKLFVCNWVYWVYLTIKPCRHIISHIRGGVYHGTYNPNLPVLCVRVSIRSPRLLPRQNIHLIEFMHTLPQHVLACVLCRVVRVYTIERTCTTRHSIFRIHTRKQALKKTQLLHTNTKHARGRA